MYPESMYILEEKVMYILEEKVIKLTAALNTIANLDLSEVTSKMNAMEVLAEMKQIASSALEE